ncbi:MAG: ABC transporter ATP-binding protein [Euryarchaeota archaeon]|nr:ABC transporter ATP-binding protein [Euryarchaeota archaeon]
MSRTRRGLSILYIIAIICGIYDKYRYSDTARSTVSWRLIELARGAWSRILLAVLIGLGVALINVAQLSITGYAIGKMFAGAEVSVVLPLLLVAALLILFRAWLTYLKETIAHYIASGIKIALRNRIYAHLTALGPGYLERRQTGELLAAAVHGVETLEIYFGKYLPQLVITLLTPIVIFTYLTILDWQLAIVLAVFFIAALTMPQWFNPSARRQRRLHWVAIAELNSYFIDSLHGLVTLKAFNHGKQRGEEITKRAVDLCSAIMRVIGINFAYIGVTNLIMTSGAAVALGWGAVRVVQGTLSIDVLLIVLLLGNEIYKPILELNTAYHGGLEGATAAGGIFNLLDTTPDVTNSPNATSKPPVAPSIRFEDVTFGYDEGKRPALSDLSFEVNSGETVALVGRSGSGKTTVINLLLRFWDPQHGKITLGGQGLRDYTLETLRAQASVVSQDTYLFHGTVADNLRVSKPDATDEELKQAARLANAHDFIKALPQGYDTIVGERGTRLSGGERQRIAIARVLLRDTPILLLDEATSSVDAENEMIIQEALDRLKQGRTTLVVAHRLSTVKGADRIVVLDDGRMVESGSHNELIGSGGIYAQLVSAQRVS